MKFSIVLALALAAGAAHAQELVARGETTVVYIADKPCTAPTVLVRIRADYHEMFRAARATAGGREYLACWWAIGDTVHLQYEDGDTGEVPIADFKQVPRV